MNDRTDRNGNNVLLIDDDPDTCMLITAMLENQGIHVETASDGLHGISKVKRADPDLVLLDIMMPGLDGWETYERIRDFHDGPVVFLSVLSDEASVARGLELGATDFLAKPFDMVEFTNHIRRLLGSSALVVEPSKGYPTVEPIRRPAPGAYLLRRSLYFQMKRIFDIMAALCALILLSPLMGIIALLIRLDSPGGAIFTQKRITSKRRVEDGRERWITKKFDFHKFRTMVENADPTPHQRYIELFINGEGAKSIEGAQNNGGIKKLVDDERVTRLGKFLRRSSLDELPQLWNVLKGDMSLVGPRPAIPYEVKLYRPWYHRRLDTIPGMTGLWQVTARSTAEFDDIVRLDIEYIQTQDFLLDMIILFKTPFVVFSMKGAI